MTANAHPGPRARGFRAARLALAAAALALAGFAGHQPQGDERAVIYLARHAEKAGGPDPGLTEAGAARAARLAEQLSGAGLQAVYATDTRRARDTAALAAEAHGLEIQSYNPFDLAAFAEQLSARGETALVIGHSNTTPALAARLGAPLDGGDHDESDYDTMYAVALGDGATRVLVAGGSAD